MHASDIAIAATESFVLPDICIRVRKMLDDHNSDIEDIANVVAMDPALASKLLRLANSPLFRFRSQVDSISKAVNIIGGEALYNLVIAETASTAIQHFAAENFDLKRYWLQSLYCGLIGKHLAKLSRVRGTERFFLLGLLHNLGEVVVAKHLPELSKQCLDLSPDISPWKRQKQVLGFTYAQCSAEILKAWELPEQLYYPVGFAHDEDKALENRDIGILFSACRAAVELVFDSEYSRGSLINPVVLGSAGLDEELMFDAVSFSRLEANKMLNIMSPA